MKILQRVLFVAIAITLLTIPTRIAYANQIDDFNRFAEGSWKSDHIPGLKISTAPYVTIEQWLINEFNTLNWGPATPQKITLSIRSNVKDFHGRVSNPLGWNNWRAKNPINDLALDDSPRQWMDKLDLRELYRFKDFFKIRTTLIDNANYGDDDLVKARALCGTFWIVENNSTAYAAFSGMLIPGRPLSGKKRVYTCVHGFTDGNALDTNKISYYFVPYGVKVEGNSRKRTRSTIVSNPDFVINKGFKVTDTYIDPDRNGTLSKVGIDDPYFKESNISTINMYDKNDYAEVEIDEYTVSRKSLKNLLTGTTNPIITAVTNLPSLNEDDGKLTVVNGYNLDPNENIFVIGIGDPGFALDHSIAVCPKVGNSGLIQNPNRSLDNNENVKAPHKIGNKGELAVSLPVYYAMSGGPILKCRLHDSNHRIKKCQVIGTVWGSERIFMPSKELSGFRCFINIR